VGRPEQRAGRPDNCSDADYTDLVPVSSATQPAYRTGEYYPPIVVSRYRAPCRRSRGDLDLQAVVNQVNGLLVAQQGEAVCKIIEVVIEAQLAVDQRVGRQDLTVGVENELSEPVSGVHQPDKRRIGVGHIKQLVVIDLCERHEPIVSATSRLDMSSRIRDLSRIPVVAGMTSRQDG
jgi:hypothetical protein